MFKIRTRITDNLDELKELSYDYFDKEWNNISGFIEVIIGNYKEGYYHENSLQDGEIGGEWLNWWLSLFCRSANNLQKNKYVAFLVPETTNRWLEFSLIDDVVVFNLALEEKHINNKVFICEKCNNFTYYEPMDYKIKFNDFICEIDNSVKRFIDDLKFINMDLLETKMVKELLNLSRTIFDCNK